MHDAWVVYFWCYFNIHHAWLKLLKKLHIYVGNLSQIFLFFFKVKLFLLKLVT